MSLPHDQLLAAVRDALVVYHSDKAYLRFVPIDMEPFRHGLSLNLLLEPNEDIEQVRTTVAEWMTEAILSLIEP